MRRLNDHLIIGVDHGYGNIKTATHCYKTGILGYDSEPLFTGDMLTYGGRYYLIGEGHKEFIAEKIKDEDYYLLTLVAIAKELKEAELSEASSVLAAGLPLTWTSGQMKEFAAYLGKNKEVDFNNMKIDYHITIDDVRIYPQGYAAIAEFASTLKGLNLVADIVNGTMNVLYMVNGRPKTERCTRRNSAPNNAHWRSGRCSCSRPNGRSTMPLSKKSSAPVRRLFPQRISRSSA